MDLLISKCDEKYVIKINGTVIPNVVDYKISSSAEGTTELEIRLAFNENLFISEMSASR